MIPSVMPLILNNFHNEVIFTSLLPRICLKYQVFALGIAFGGPSPAPGNALQAGSRDSPLAAAPAGTNLVAI
jgi:hypothetical protein